jgi:hypothetical protein
VSKKRRCVTIVRSGQLSEKRSHSVAVIDTPEHASVDARSLECDPVSAVAGGLSVRPERPRLQQWSCLRSAWPGPVRARVTEGDRRTRFSPSQVSGAARTAHPPIRPPSERASDARCAGNGRGKTPRSVVQGDRRWLRNHACGPAFRRSVADGVDMVATRVATVRAERGSESVRAGATSTVRQAQQGVGSARAVGRGGEGCAAAVPRWSRGTRALGQVRGDGHGGTASGCPQHCVRSLGGGRRQRRPPSAPTPAVMMPARVSDHG